jgi:hypothetical protein
MLPQQSDAGECVNTPGALAAQGSAWTTAGLSHRRLVAVRLAGYFLLSESDACRVRDGKGGKVLPSDQSKLAPGCRKHSRARKGS